VTAAVDLAAMASEMMVETAPAAMEVVASGRVVLRLGWWQVAAAEAMAGAEATSAMAEAMAVMVAAAAAAAAGRRSGNQRGPKSISVGLWFKRKLPHRLLHAAAFLIVSSRRVASVVIMASEMRYVDGMPPGRPWVIRGDVVHLVFRF
jgi:hypothetical protein